MDIEDSIAQLAALVDQECMGRGMGGEALGETVHVDGDARVDGIHR